MTSPEQGAARDLLPPAQRTLPVLLQRAAALFGDRPLLCALGGGESTHAMAAQVAAERAEIPAARVWRCRHRMGSRYLELV